MECFYLKLLMHYWSLINPITTIQAVVSVVRWINWVSLFFPLQPIYSYITQCAESGGQGDLGQIFIRNVNFQEDTAQNKTANASGTKKPQIRAFKWGIVRCYTTQWPNLYILYQNCLKWFHMFSFTNVNV